MANIIQIKKGLEANRLGITPHGGELIWTVDEHQLYVGDGQTPGGISVTEKALRDYIPTSEKGSSDGVATLGPNGKIPSEQLPAIDVGQVDVVDTRAEMYALTDVTVGDVCVVTGSSNPDEAGNFIARTSSPIPSDPIDASDWIELASRQAPVQSVNGQTGTVVLFTDDIREGSDLYFTDARAQESANTKIQNTINDNAGIGDTDLLWSADKIATELGNGIITTLEGLTDTDTTSANTDDCLVFRNGKWTATPPETISFSFGELDNVDVSVDLANEGDCLTFTSGQWTATPPQDIFFSIGELTNVDALADSSFSGQVLISDGTNYYPSELVSENVKVGDNYSKPSTSTPIIQIDTVEQALGKLEVGIDEAKTPQRLGWLSNVPEFQSDNSDAGKILTVDSSGQAVEFKISTDVGRTTLVALDDTNITAAQNGQVLTYDSANSIWINQNLPQGIEYLADLNDTAIYTPTNGQMLIWSGDTGRWINVDMPYIPTNLINLNDTPASYGQPGQYLVVNNTQDGFEYSNSIDGGTF